MAPPAPATVLQPPRIDRTVSRDIGTGESTFVVHRDDGVVRLEETGTVLSVVKTLRFRIRDDDPASASAEAEVAYRLAREEWTPEVRARSILTASREAFELRTEVDARYQGETVHARSWTHRVPRDLL
jgi:hypothetical protein